MTKQQAVFTGVMIYSLFGAYFWMVIYEKQVIAFLIVIAIGLPVPFVVDRIWEALQ